MQMKVHRDCERFHALYFDAPTAQHGYAQATAWEATLTAWALEQAGARLAVLSAAQSSIGADS